MRKIEAKNEGREKESRLEGERVRAGVGRTPPGAGKIFFTNVVLRKSKPRGEDEGARKGRRGGGVKFRKKAK